MENERALEDSFYIRNIIPSSLTVEECQKSALTSALKGFQNLSKTFFKKSLEPDLLKARPASPIGSEKIWSGITYVKTASGWKPKGKIKEGKAEEVSQVKNPKLEEDSVPKEKQIENFATGAKDSQLEAALKDPKQDEEVKKIAEAELEKRKSELTEDLDKKKKETKEKKAKPEKKETKEKKPKPEKKELKEVGISFSGLDKNLIAKMKMALEPAFLYMSGELSYWLKKAGKSDEDIQTFLDANYPDREAAIQQREEKVKEWASTKEERFKKEAEAEAAQKALEKKELRPDNMEQLTKAMDEHIRSKKAKKDLEETYEYIQQKCGTEREVDDRLTNRRKNMMSMENASSNPINILAANKFLVSVGELPYCNPIFYEKFRGESYRVFENDINSDIAQGYFSDQKEKNPPTSRAVDEALDSFVKDGYEILNEYGLTGKITKGTLGEVLDADDEAFSGIETTAEACEKAKELLKSIDTYIDSCPPIGENLILSRRVRGSAIEEIVRNLNVDDTFEMKPLQSFSLVAMQGFGECQITLITKKGDKGIAPLGDESHEMEYITRTNSKVRVISKGFNSMAVELIQP